MKFKVGDKVRVKGMKNRKFTITEVDTRGKQSRYRDIYEWFLEQGLELDTDPLVKKIEERNHKPNILEGNDMNQPIDDPIKPTHYRKGEMDLYEAWSKMYPPNEFRAIMQAVAMRYMFRDKDNRVEDLEKARYTLERLKEYEVQNGKN